MVGKCGRRILGGNGVSVNNLAQVESTTFCEVFSRYLRSVNPQTTENIQLRKGTSAAHVYGMSANPARQSSRANQMMAGIHANSRHAERRVGCFSAAARVEGVGGTTGLAI